MGCWGTIQTGEGDGLNGRWGRFAVDLGGDLSGFLLRCLLSLVRSGVQAVVGSVQPQVYVAAVAVAVQVFLSYFLRQFYVCDNSKCVVGPSFAFALAPVRRTCPEYADREKDGGQRRECDRDWYWGDSQEIDVQQRYPVHAYGLGGLKSPIVFDRVSTFCLGWPQSQSTKVQKYIGSQCQNGSGTLLLG